ncbi:hypothetical protein C8J56DRAFT_868948 [Mycena floridula]|nr:hypothetical protein C8J56DRAFT_868948 [Mycena floridula]
MSHSTSDENYQVLSRPPSYTSRKSPVPVYSTEPVDGERTLAYRPRVVGSNTRPEGLFIQKFQDSNITIGLENQEKYATRPSYGRGAVVAGFLVFDDCDSIVCVTLKITGVLYYLIAQGYSSIRLCDDSHTLFENPANGEATPISCPTTLPFSFLFPSRVDNQAQLHPLPPTYHMKFSENQFIECSYTFYITVSRSRPSILSVFGKSNSTFSLDINYRPRTRPARPVLHNELFSHTIKACPEEWQQHIFSIPCPSPQNAITCQMFTPSVGVFSIQDKIPFYVQLTGPVSSLHALKTPGTISSPENNVVGIRVYLLRQTILIIDGERFPKHSTLGEGTLVARPPILSSEEDTLTWEGQVSCSQDVSSGSFFAGIIAVEDFLTFELPYRIAGQAPEKFRRGIFIRLVTDSWIDAPAAPGILES